MQTLNAALGDRSYPIHVGAGLLRNHELLRSAVRSRQLLLVSNTIVAPLYAAQLRAAFPGRQIVDVILPDGEQHKTLATASRIFDVLMANRFARDCSVLALGGGVVGDISGFVAACYQRGVPYFQFPTTLLADVDSSVGGKTAVNHPGGKNMIGAFYQPSAVFADVDLLATLPERELAAGLAEIIKYGLALDVEFLGWLETNMAKLRARDGAALAAAIYRSCEIKAGIVARDEREIGDRALLNFGHTFGHAIEAATRYTEWLHGEAVGAGMRIAADMSRRMGSLTGADTARIEKVLSAAGLDRPAPQCGIQTAFEYMGIDKKVQGGRVRLVLLQKIGQAVLTGDYDDAILEATLRAHFG
jgi:3-dehydroquinate synthase